MKKGVGPNDIPVEVWKYLEEKELECFARLLIIAIISLSERTAEEWGKSTLLEG